MKRTGLVVIGTMVIASLSVGAAIAQGQGGPGGPGRPGGPPPGGGGPLGQILHGFTQALPPPQVTEQLDLTDAQQTKIESIMSAERSSTKAASEKMRSLANEGRKLALSSAFTESAASTLATKEAAEAEPIVLSSQKAMSDIFKTVLTSDQRSQLATLKDNPPMRGGPPADRMVQMLTRQLDLTSDQQSQITSLLTSDAATRSADVKSVASIWTSYQKAHSDSTYDEAAVKAAYTSAEQPVEDFLTSDMKTQNQIWSQLTDSQKTKFESLPAGGFGGPPPGGAGFGRGGRQPMESGGGAGTGNQGAPPDDQGGPPPGDQGGPPPPDDQGGPPPGPPPTN